jgi:hypothetical protein
MMIDWVTPGVWGAAAHSLEAVRIGPARQGRGCGWTDGRQELAAVYPHRLIVTPPLLHNPCGPTVDTPTGGGSGRGQGVVTELTQDMRRPPDDLPCLGDGGAFTVVALLDLGVVGVVGGAGAGMVLPAS